MEAAAERRFMNHNQKALRTGALVIVGALLLRLLLGIFMGDGSSIFSYPRLASFLIHSQTGRDPAVPVPDTQPTDPTTVPTSPTEPSTQPTEPTPPPIAVERPTFTADEAGLINVNYGTRLRPDLKELLLQKLDWDLTGEEPTILILHTHGTEAFTPTAERPYEEYGGEYRTKDDRYNMISIGDELTRLLTEKGLTVLHDRTPHDLNDYNDAYNNSRAAVQEYLKQYPSIKMILDVHRDAAEYSDGTQWATSATVDGQPSAQVMLVVGSSASDAHPNWKTNLSLAEKLYLSIQRTCPGVERPINLRAKIYNQDLSTGSLIVEVGSTGNTHEEAMRALPVLSEAILQLVYGAN